MKNFRNDMAPVSGDVTKTINDLANPKWAIPFLGRRLSSTCKDKFTSQFHNPDTDGFCVELPWDGQEKHVTHNAYDDSTYVHELVVTVYQEGPARGRIKSIHAHHWRHWHTTSNWQDHGESRTYEEREPNVQEIEYYKELLEAWTEGGSSELVQSLSQALAVIVRERNGQIRVEFCEHEEYPLRYRAISISISREGLPSPVSIVINLDHLFEALDYSRIYIEAIYSKEDRRQLGICKDESWTLQYCLNFFNVFEAEQLYQNIDLALKAWLYKLYSSCSYYREFMNTPLDLWWRDAWWRLQEVIGGKYRTLENQILVGQNCHENNYSAKPCFEKDPFCGLVGKLSIPCAPSIQPFSVDDAVFYSRLVKGGRERYKFSHVKVNGINWSICIHNQDEIAIDLATSEAVEKLDDGVAVVPYQIDGHTVTAIHMIDKVVEKDWRKVVFEAPCNWGINSDRNKTTHRPFDDDDDTSQKVKGLGVAEGAFRGWRSLEEIVFERSAWLGAYAFEGCGNLKKVVFDDNNCTVGVGDRCFRACSSLAEIGTIASVGAESFKDCISLKHIGVCCNVQIYESNIRWNESAFEGCTALETFDIDIGFVKGDENKCCSLSRRMFWGCVALKQIHLPKSIKILEDECLGGCSPDCVVHYEGDAFWFVGNNALPKLKDVYYWGMQICYEKEQFVLSSLLDKLGIKRDQYVDACNKYQQYCSIEAIISIIKGGKPPPRCPHYLCDDYVDDCMPRTFEDAYEIYGSRLWDA